MKYFLGCLAILAVAHCADVGLRVRFGVGLGIGKNFFYDIPRSVQHALNESWQPILRPAGPLSALSLYCPSGDRTFCAFYEDTGYIAGVQISLEQDKFVGVFDLPTQGFTNWTTPDDQKSYWTIEQFFVNETYLARSVEDRILSRDLTKTLQLDGIWTTGIDRQLLKIATAEEGIRNSIFTEQACIPWMGRHYYHNMSATTECTSEAMYPWFPLVNNGALIGTGLMVFGTLPQDGGRDWFERPSRSAVEVIVPRGPECMYALAASPGVVTMHIYYIDNPWLVFTC